MATFPTKFSTNLRTSTKDTLSGLPLWIRLAEFKIPPLEVTTSLFNCIHVNSSFSAVVQFLSPEGDAPHLL
jgi:hypothetical protein